MAVETGSAEHGTKHLVLEEKGVEQDAEKGSEDVSTLSKGVEDVIPPGQGSSRVTGGILRGRAMGNVLNQSDAPDILVDEVIPSKGLVRLYSDLSHQPFSHKPTITMKTETKPTLGPILQKLGRNYSPVRSKSSAYSFQPVN